MLGIAKNTNLNLISLGVVIGGSIDLLYKLVEYRDIFDIEKAGTLL